MGRQVHESILCLEFAVDRRRDVGGLAAGPSAADRSADAASVCGRRNLLSEYRRMGLLPGSLADLAGRRTRADAEQTPTADGQVSPELSHTRNAAGGIGRRCSAAVVAEARRTGGRAAGPRRRARRPAKSGESTLPNVPLPDDGDAIAAWVRPAIRIRRRRCPVRCSAQIARSHDSRARPPRRSARQPTGDRECPRAIRPRHLPGRRARRSS